MARCSNCKAPLRDGFLTCEYCGDRNDVDLKEIHYYTTHQSDVPRTCPRCDIELLTIDLKLNGTFLIERCDQCLGLFFDPVELEVFLNAAVTNVFQIDRIGIDSINLNWKPNQYPIAYIKCPVCAQLMHRVNFGAKSGVVIDSCKIHGVWLDGGKLRHLMEWMKMGGKLLDRDWQEKAKKEDLKRRKDLRRSPAGYHVNSTPTSSQGGLPSGTDLGLSSIICDITSIFD